MAPLAAPLALGWLGCCFCCDGWFCAGGGAVEGCVCADNSGTTAGITDNAIPKQINFAERFM
jgi:hypothetical protein